MAKSSGKAAKAAPKKAASKKADAKKAESKKADAKKADAKKTASKKADSKKADSKKADSKKVASKKSDKKAASKKSDSTKPDSKKADSKAGGSEDTRATPTKDTPDIPSTLERSPDPKAARTFVAAHDSAVQTYGHGARATRTALGAVKHSFEKVGDHWEPKGKKGPSDSQAASPRGRSGTSAGGVDASATRAHLYLLAQRLDVPGRSRMSKAELIEALQKANDSATAKARR